jgi:hypothetical protein
VVGVGVDALLGLATDIKVLRLAHLRRSTRIAHQVEVRPECTARSSSR